MQGGATGRAWETLRIAALLVALALALSACGGGDDDAGDEGRASTTATQKERARPLKPRTKPTPAPNVPTGTADDVAEVRRALEAAGFTVKRSRGAGRALVSLQVGETLVSFYRSDDDAAGEAGALKRVLEEGPGGGAVRASANRLYFSGGKADERFSKIVATAEGAL